MSGFLIALAVCQELPCCLACSGSGYRSDHDTKCPHQKLHYSIHHPCQISIQQPSKYTSWCTQMVHLHFIMLSSSHPINKQHLIKWHVELLSCNTMSTSSPIITQIPLCHTTLKGYL